MNKHNTQYSMYPPFAPYIHPNHQPSNPQASNNQTSNHNKQKQHHSNNQGYFYQNTSHKLPIYKNVNQPIYQAFPNGEANSSAHFKPGKIPGLPPVPTIVRLSNTGKLNRMMRNNQPGKMVLIMQMGDAHSMLMAAKWDVYVYYRGQNYYTHLIAEFYTNMEVYQREDGIFYLSSFVNNKNIHIDHHVISKGLRVDNRNPTLPCMNVYEKFVFEKKEFELYLGLFCNEDVPKGLCEKDCGINFRHFLPKYQQLASILRANIIPKPKQDKFFDFVDLKIMFQLASNNIEFNPSYLILLNMIHAHHVDYMPYGLLLTSIFEMHHVFMTRIFASKEDYTLIENLVSDQVSLRECKPHSIYKVLIPSPLTKSDQNYLEVEKLETKVGRIENALEYIKEVNKKTLIRLSVLESKLGAHKGTIECIDLETTKVYEEEMVNELVAVGLNGKCNEILPALEDLPDTLGFVASG